MPLSKKGQKILAGMRKQYGDRAENVLYASIRAGRISGADPTFEKKMKQRKK